MNWWTWTKSEVISVTFSTSALIVSFGSFWVSWRALRRNIKSERPIFWARQSQYPVPPSGWHNVQVNVRNRAPHAIQCEQIEVRRPRGAVIVSNADVTQKKNGGATEIKPDLSPAEYSGSARMRLAAAHAGQKQEPPQIGALWIRTLGTNDTENEGIPGSLRSPFEILGARFR